MIIWPTRQVIRDYRLSFLRKLREVLREVFRVRSLRKYTCVIGRQLKSHDDHVELSKIHPTS